MTENASDYDLLFHEYLRICNEALEHNKHCFPYDRIVQKVKDRLADHTVQAAIYEDDEEHPAKRYDLILKDGQLAAKAPHRPHSRHPWLLSRYFLEQVVQQPETYICNPAQLNWQWLTDQQIGL